MPLWLSSEGAGIEGAASTSLSQGKLSKKSMKTSTPGQSSYFRLDMRNYYPPSMSRWPTPVECLSFISLRQLVFSSCTGLIRYWLSATSGWPRTIPSGSVEMWWEYSHMLWSATVSSEWLCSLIHSSWNQILLMDGLETVLSTSIQRDLDRST